MDLFKKNQSPLDTVLESQEIGIKMVIISDSNLLVVVVRVFVIFILSSFVFNLLHYAILIYKCFLIFTHNIATKKVVK